MPGLIGFDMPNAALPRGTLSALLRLQHWLQLQLQEELQLQDELYLWL